MVARGRTQCTPTQGRERTVSCLPQRLTLFPRSVLDCPELVCYNRINRTGKNLTIINDNWLTHTYSMLIYVLWPAKRNMTKGKQMKITLAENIKKMRTQKSLTQSDLAEALSVTPQSVSRWENGLAYPDTQLLPEIAR